MIKVIVYGANGHLGKLVINAVENDPNSIVAAKVSKSGANGAFKELSDFDGEADVVIDFSHHEGTAKLLEDCIAKNIPLVLATTGQTEDELKLIEEASKKIPIFFSANMSVGIAILAQLVKEVAAKFNGSEIEIVEYHHNRKLDAPSGTAILLADAAKESRTNSEYVLGRNGHHKREKNEIGINAVRMGNIVGTHEVMFGTNSQTITLKHEAHDRALFADGSLDAAKFIIGKEPELYNMQDMLA